MEIKGKQSEVKGMSKRLLSPLIRLKVVTNDIIMMGLVGFRDTQECEWKVDRFEEWENHCSNKGKAKIHSEITYKGFLTMNLRYNVSVSFKKKTDERGMQME